VVSLANPRPRKMCTRLTVTEAKSSTPTRLSADAPQISHAVLLMGSQLTRALLRLFFVLIAARALGPGQFGIYTLLLAVVEILAVISGIGHGEFLSREAAREERLGWGVGEQLIGLRIVYAIPLAGAAIGLLGVLGYSRSVLVAGAWMALTLAPRSMSEAVQGVLRGVGKCWDYLAIDVVLGCALVLGAGVLLFRNGGIVTAVVAELAAAVAAGTVAFGLFLRRRTKETIRLPWPALVRKSAIFNVYPFVINLYDRADVLLLSKLAGDYATGLYGIAYRPLGTLQLLPYGVLYSLLPTLSRNPRGRAEKQRLERAMGLLLSAAFGVVLGTMVFADSAVRLLLGERYAVSAVALKILIWAVILRYVNSALNVYLLAGQQERVFLPIAAVCLGVNIIGNLLLIPIYSWRAAALLTIATEVVLLVQNVYWLRRTVGYIPKPHGALRTSLVFSVLLISVVAGARVIPLLFIGSAGVLLFAAYLYRTGMLREFAEAWRATV